MNSIQLEWSRQQIFEKQSRPKSTRDSQNCCKWANLPLAEIYLIWDIRLKEKNIDERVARRISRMFSCDTLILEEAWLQHTILKIKYKDSCIIINKGMVSSTPSIKLLTIPSRFKRDSFVTNALRFLNRIIYNLLLIYS